MKSNGYIIYQGPSLLDGKPIVAIATGFKVSSRNVKTGDMIQTWILREDINPIEAVRTKEDASVCGDCKHRGTTCYVRTEWGVNNVWKAIGRGMYPFLGPHQLGLLGHDRVIRIGSYGDPAAVPFPVWWTFTRQARVSTGYTHQWRRSDSQVYQQLCMASVDSEEEYREAKAMGWRTFRVRRANEEPLRGEVICPASAEAGHKTTCEECRACGGLNAKARADIVIRIHGSPKRVKKFEIGDLFQ